MPAPPEHREGLALCLSGGGYRATLFELGALRRLDELGVLSRARTISSVSAGGIASAHLAGSLDEWPAAGDMVDDFDARIARKVERFVARNLRTAPLVARWLMPWRWRSDTAAIDHLVRLFERHLPDVMLRDLVPGGGKPRFVFGASDNVFAATWEMSADRTGSAPAGYTDRTDWSIGRAVAVSACFPPAFEAAAANVDPGDLVGGDRAADAERDALVAGMRLNDGGLIDELALEPVWRDHRTVIVMDGGSTFGASSDHGLMRDVQILREQVRRQRKRWLISSFVSGQLEGTVIGTESSVSHYDSDAEGYSPELVADVIAPMRTDFDRASPAEAAVLQNHGYLLMDVAARRHLAPHMELRSTSPRPPHPDLMDEGHVRDSLADSASRQLLGRGRWLPYLFV